MGLVTGWLYLPFTLLGLMHLDLTILCLLACGGCTGNRWTRASCCTATCKKSCARDNPDVSIRQHMSAYVSIRQHTSAYVSICQCKYSAEGRPQHALRVVGDRVHLAQHRFWVWSVTFARAPSRQKSRQLLGHEILNDFLLLAHTLARLEAAVV